METSLSRSRDLRAVVIGAGWAAEGHVKALRHSGVEVVAICARQQEVVREVADRLGIPEASIDWRQTIERVKPDIVTLATPASLRVEPIEFACKLGCNIMSEKPLAINAAEAERLVDVVERAGTKHAFGTIHRYAPAIRWMAELVQRGAIGTLRQIELTGRSSFYDPLFPWTWADSLALGGGLLSNVVIHSFAQIERVAGGQIARAAGAAQPGRDRAPFLPDIHDFRRLFAGPLTPDEAARLEWRDCDADNSCIVLLELTSQLTSGTPIEAVIIASAVMDERMPGNGWRLHGDTGTLAVSDDLSRVWLYRSMGTDPEEQPVPQSLLESLPKVGDDLQNRWGALFRDFVADIRGEAHQPYPTIRDGWRYQEVIDSIRAGEGWHEIPARQGSAT